MNKLAGLLFLLLIIWSCSKDSDNDPDGKWSDNIHLSTKSVMLNSTPDSAVITTEGSWWWVGGISFGDSLYSYYGRNDINLESSSYRIEEDEFVVERQDSYTLFVKMEANNTGEERVLKISLEAGDYFDGVTVTQAAN